MLTRKTILLFFLLFTASIWAQNEQPLVSEDLELVKDRKNAFYTFNYPSVDADGNPIVLSSAFVSWKKMSSDSIQTVIIACHYTITNNYECPSEYMNTGSTTSDIGILANIPTMGLTYERLRHSIIIMPDYEGYGVTKDRTHPYLSQKLTARQVIDGVQYGLKLYQKLVDAGTNPPLQKDWKSFCMGYSQGGSVALAAHRHIEQNGLSDELHFSGSLCGDGPYDPISTLQYYVNDDGTSHDAKTEHRKNMLTMPVVMPLILKGMLCSHPDMRAHQTSDYFTKKFLDTGVMGWLEDKAKEKDEQKTTDDIDKLFYELCEKGLTAADGTTYTPEDIQEMFPTHKRSGTFITGYNYTVYADLSKILTPECYAYLSNSEIMADVPEESGDPMKDLHRALADNSVAKGWEPQQRVVFMHSKHDTVVPYDNYLAFANAHPDSENTKIEILGSSDHVSTGTSFYSSLLTSGHKTHFEWLAEGYDIIERPTNIIPIATAIDNTAVIYDLSGRRLSNGQMPKGLYIVNGKKYFCN